jgi:NAD(P)-dependent dehydrogenase (short-subunit alcohol dehydrogenase family)
MSARTVVVTGTSTGLGRACALHLVRLGFRVLAGVRRPEDGDRLAAEAGNDRLRPLPLDVTRPEQIDEAAAAVDGPLWGLVNNAGISVAGPLECIPTEALRRQFETNVIGSFAVTRALLPALRRGRGRVVNVTSGLGRVALPYLGAYAAAQFAKEGLSDALRRELRPFGVSVTVVRPGAIATPIWDKLAAEGRALPSFARDGDSPYHARFLHFLRANARQVERSRVTPDDFAAVVARALTVRRPRTRYAVGPDARLAGLAGRLVPDRVLDRFLEKGFHAD